MRILDRLLGKPTIPSFAAALIKAIKQSGEKADLRFDPANHRIVAGAGSDFTWTFNLTNVYQTYKELPRSQRPPFIRVCVQSILVNQKQLPDDFDLVRADLRPRLWLRASFEQMRIRSLLESAEPKPLDLPAEPIGEHLLLSLAYDWPHAVQSISFYEAMEFARDQLRDSTVSYAKMSEGLYSFMSGDTYDASRIALIDRIESFEVKGKPVAIVPSRDALFVTGSDDEAGLTALAALARHGLTQPYSLSAIPLILEDGQWQDWLIPPDHPNHADFHQLELSWLAPLYDHQESDLKQIMTRQNLDIFVARFFTAQSQNGQLITYCVWGKDTDTLLPVTQRICFFQSEATPPLFADWSTTIAHCAHLMERTEHYPPRYRVRDFPDQSTLEKIALPNL
jgi:hypothetical protein